jgi:hypothetical protein
MDPKETKKTTVEDTPGERKTTEETHREGEPGRDVLLHTTERRPGTPATDDKKVTVEKK